MRWCLAVLEALVHLHTLPAPVVHRDLKLENVLIKPAPGGSRAVLADYGLAAVRAVFSYSVWSCMLLCNGVSGRARVRGRRWWGGRACR